MLIYEIISFEDTPAVPASNPLRMRPGARTNRPDIKTPLKLPDGYMWIDGHFQDRIIQRQDDLSLKEVSDTVKKAVRVFGDTWKNFGRTSFIIRKPNRFAASVHKIPQMDDSFKYLLKTIHPNLHLGADQEVFDVF